MVEGWDIQILNEIGKADGSAVVGCSSAHLARYNSVGVLPQRRTINDGHLSFTLLSRLNSRNGGSQFPAQVWPRLDLIGPRPLGPYSVFTIYPSSEVLGCRLASLKVCSVQTRRGVGWWGWIPAQQAVESRRQRRTAFLEMPFHWSKHHSNIVPPMTGEQPVGF